MSATELNTLLDKLGADQVRAPFSGGNDEGGVDAVEVFRGEEIITEITWGEKDSPTKARIFEIMEAPVDAEYSGFAGDFYVSGVVEFKKGDKQLQMRRVETFPQDQDEETLYF